MESGQYADVRERCLPGNDWFVTRMIAIACICATLAASPYGCSWPGRPCQDPTIVAVVPAQGNPWWLSYECYWKCSDINVSPEGLLTLGDWDPFPESMHVAPAPEAMIAVADRVLMVADGKAHLLSPEDDELTAHRIGDCPRDVRQMTVVPGANSLGGVSLAILAGGEYEDQRLRGAEIYAATIKGDQLRFESSGYDSSWNPWLLRGGSMGDQQVLFVGAFKKAHFDQAERKRPQLFGVVCSEPVSMRPL